jgi:predicted nucleic acid-binding protein
VRFWDSSAIVPLLVQQAASDEVRAAYVSDPGMVVWWGTRLECASALARLRQMGLLDEDGRRSGGSALQDMCSTWTEIEPTAELRELARSMLDKYELTTGDALQLAAANCASQPAPESLEFLSLDKRLLDAAGREGFRLVLSSAAGGG